MSDFKLELNCPDCSTPLWTVTGAWTRTSEAPDWRRPSAADFNVSGCPVCFPGSKPHLGTVVGTEQARQIKLHGFVAKCMTESNSLETPDGLSGEDKEREGLRLLEEAWAEQGKVGLVFTRKENHPPEENVLSSAHYTALEHFAEGTNSTIVTIERRGDGPTELSDAQLGQLRDIFPALRITRQAHAARLNSKYRPNIRPLTKQESPSWLLSVHKQMFLHEFPDRHEYFIATKARDEFSFTLNGATVSLGEDIDLKFVCPAKDIRASNNVHPVLLLTHDRVFGPPAEEHELHRIVQNLTSNPEPLQLTVSNKQCDLKLVFEHVYVARKKMGAVVDEYYLSCSSKLVNVSNPYSTASTPADEWLSSVEQLAQTAVDGAVHDYFEHISTKSGRVTADEKRQAELKRQQRQQIEAAKLQLLGTAYIPPKSSDDY